MPGKPSLVSPNWYRQGWGWRDVSGIDQSPLAEGEERCKASLSQFLREQFHGHWYPDATVVTVAAVATHVLTRFHFGWAWYLIILAFCHSHYSASMRRFRAHASDDILRQLVKRRLAHRAPKIESVEWLNKLLDRLWLVYEPNFSRTVGALVDRVLQQHCPESLDSVRLSTFSLGSKAPRIDTAETCAHVEDDVVTLKQNLVKPSVVVNARSGRHPGRSFFLDNICFRGHLEIHFKCAPIISPEMMISAVGHSFVEKPALDYVLKPVHGELFETLDTVNVHHLCISVRNTADDFLHSIMSSNTGIRSRKSSTRDPRYGKLGPVNQTPVAPYIVE